MRSGQGRPGPSLPRPGDRSRQWRRPSLVAGRLAGFEVTRHADHFKRIWRAGQRGDHAGRGERGQRRGRRGNVRSMKFGKEKTPKVKMPDPGDTFADHELGELL